MKSWEVVNNESIRMRNTPKNLSVSSSSSSSSSDSDMMSSLFEIVPGVYKPGDESRACNFNKGRYDKCKDTLVSFKCKENGHYLRHCCYWMRSHPYTNDEVYRMDATFYMTKNEFFDGTKDGADGNDYYSFRSINFDHMHLCHRGLSLKIDYGDDIDLHKKNASFVLEVFK